jgi:hypothetical protein
MSSEKKTKKPLTSPEIRHDTILCKLKLLAQEKQFGKLKCEIVIHAGYISEIRHSEFEGVIR